MIHDYIETALAVGPVWAWVATVGLAGLFMAWNRLR